MTTKSGTVKNVWLTVLSGGGYTTAQEVRQAAEVPRADRILQTLASQGCCIATDDPDRTGGVRYGITPACKVPRDVKLGEILKAAGAS